MAAETFSYNFFNEDLEKKALQQLAPKNVIWLNSKFISLKPRLRENPFEYPEVFDEGFNNLPDNQEDLNGKLIVGSIIELNRLLKSSPKLVELLKNAFGREGGLDLVSGGPPCQSFSMAGKREKDSNKNSLPWEFANFVDLTQPKIFLLENVTGILRAFKDKSGQKFHAWYEIAKVFASIGYIPLCLHINAKMVGIPQNRPRFIMIGIRLDHFKIISKKFNIREKELFEKSINFFKLTKKFGENLEFGHLRYFDSSKSKDLPYFLETFLVSLVNSDEVSVHKAINDLKINNPTKPSLFVKKINSEFSNLVSRKKILNHELRKNSPLVKRRFRLYQVLQSINQRFIKQSVVDVLKGKEKEIPEEAWLIIATHTFLNENGKLQRFTNKIDFEGYLTKHATKKQTQKALIADSPAPAALSIPDDTCHYDKHEIRVLTVREMARIQSFPDNFVFKSKITTGGKMRKFEVPQYTQVGNAVPPLLGSALGACIKNIL